LDEQADDGQEAIYPSHNPDGYPVDYTDEELEPPGIVLIDKDLFRRDITHAYTS
jgi:hypothetical protein